MTAIDIFKKKLGGELSSLTKDQLSAVMHDRGGALCIAGPGSGKTRVISLRAARLWALYGGLENDGGSGSRGRDDGCSGVVLTLSFNKPACEEMKARGLEYIKRLGGSEDTKAAAFYTVHAYCYRLVREYLKLKGLPIPRVLDPGETSEIIEKLYGEMTGGGRLPQSEMKMLKNYIVTENMEADFDFGGLGKDLAKEIRKNYGLRKERMGVIDFGDMLGLSLKYLRSDRDFLNRTRSAYIFTQVDEAQDLSTMQAEVVKLISNGNVFYVADDDQSIYGFRGANPGTVRSLRERGGQFKTYMLEKNFRSTGDIVNLSSWFIRANEDRFDKRISASRERGGKVSLRYFSDTTAQALFCAELIKKRAKQKRSICVLYRNNASGLPVGTALFLSLGKRDNLRPLVKGEKILFGELDYTRFLYRALKEKEGGRPLARLFSKLPGDIYRDMKKTGEADMIAARAFGGRRPFFRESAVTAAEYLLEKAVSADDFLRLTEGVDSFLESGDDPSVSFSTVHSAKGLEYDTVVIVDCVEGEFPFGDIRREEQVREERRLMYVALTRAKNEVVLTYPGKCGKLELTASRFIDEIEDFR